MNLSTKIWLDNIGLAIGIYLFILVMMPFILIYEGAYRLGILFGGDKMR